MDTQQIAHCVQRTVQGDTKAFEELYAATNQRVYFLCLHFLKNEHDAKDAVQDTYLSAYKHIRQLSEPSKFPAWVERIAVNVCKQMARKKTPEPLEDEILFETLAADDELVLPEQYIIDAEKRRVLLEMMQNTLSDLQYRTVILYYFGNFTAPEIADMMDCTEGAVKNRLTTARAKIRKAIDAYQKDSNDKLFVFVGVPFLARVFDEESKTLTAPPLHTAMLTGYGASVTASASTAGTTFKTGGMMMNKKIVIAIVAGVLAVGGVTAGIVAGVAAHQSQPAASESSVVSAVSQVSSVTEESMVHTSTEHSSDGEPSQTASSTPVEESSTDNQMPNWTYRAMQDPVIGDTVYIEHPERQVNGKPTRTATPAITVDFEKAEQLVREHPKFASLEFVHQEMEYQNYEHAASVEDTNEAAAETKYWLRGYDKTLAECKEAFAQESNMELAGGEVRILSEFEHYGYDKPHNFSLVIEKSDITQEEVFELLKGVMDEKIAEYLVYREPVDYEEGDTSTFFSVSLKTSDGTGTYNFQRSISRNSLAFSVSYSDVCALGANYKNNYQPVAWGFSLSNMLKTDLGNTDYKKPEDFLSKVLSYDTQYDPYQRTTVESETLHQVTFSDGAVLSDFSITAHRISEASDLTIIQGSLEGTVAEQRGNSARAITLKGRLTQQKDGSLEIHSLSFSLPTTHHVMPDYDAAVVDECLAIAEQQAIAVFGLDKKVFDSVAVKTTDKEPNSTHKSRKLELSVKDIPLRIWGQDKTVSVWVSAFGEGVNLGSAVPRSTYYSGFGISFEG